MSDFANIKPLSDLRLDEILSPPGWTGDGGGILTAAIREETGRLLSRS